MFKNFIQIAGVVDIKEAEMLIDCGVNYLGFPLRLLVNKEDLSEEEAQRIVSCLKPPNHGILITYLNNAKETILLSKKIGVNIVQFHGEIELGELIKLKKDFPEVKIIKSLIVGKSLKEELLHTVFSLEDFVDAFITDSFDSATGATGATGLVHNWNISQELVKYSKKPIILAGGLNPENVYDAIVKVKPAGVDSHTGVENNFGRKSKKKIFKFIAEAKKGFKKIQEAENG